MTHCAVHLAPHKAPPTQEMRGLFGKAVSDFIVVHSRYRTRIILNRFQNGPFVSPVFKWTSEHFKSVLTQQSTQLTQSTYSTVHRVHWVHVDTKNAASPGGDTNPGSADPRTVHKVLQTQQFKTSVGAKMPSARCGIQILGDSAPGAQGAQCARSGI